MTSSRSHFDAAAEDQAALWAARLEGSTLSAEDRAAMEAWLAETPATADCSPAIASFPADLEKHLPTLVESGAVLMPPKSAPTRRWKRSWIAAGSLATMAAAAAIVWVATPTPTGRFATPVGQRQSLTLNDGTKIELNARTQLLVLKTDRERRVRLIEGEAFFMVSKDPTHPFIVETPAGSVRVTGTRFDVRSEEKSELEVTVDEGSVQVRPTENSFSSAAEAIVLAAGDQWKQPAGHVDTRRRLSSDQLENTLAWRRGKVVFDGTSLQAALARFARYNGREISVTAGAANLGVGGVFAIDDVDSFLSQMEKSQPVHVSILSNGTIRVSLKNEP